MKEHIKLLLACDLDGTVLPNGAVPLSEGAMGEFKNIVSQESICLVYLSGRSLNHALNGISEFGVPLPQIFVGDTGTTMYFLEDEVFNEHKEWQEIISSDWGNMRGKDIHKVLQNIQLLTPQEKEHQNIFKQSYYFPPKEETRIIKEVKEEIAILNIKAEVVTLLDHFKNKGYLDILPKSASKLSALEYIQKHLKVDREDIVFAGDGGNDLPPLTSGYKAIVVNNASQVFKDKVATLGKEKSVIDHIYFAKGGFRGMNGNYVSGVLEGLAHFEFI